MSDASVLGEVASRLPTGSQLRPRPLVDHLLSLVVGGGAGRLRRLHLLYAGAQRLVRTTELGEALAVLENHLQQAVAEMAPRRLFVHAGVVGWNGKAILVPGTSHAGKSTLVAALLRAGASYYSDEYAVLDRRGRVHPFPRALQLRNGDEVGRRIAPEELGAERGREPLPVGLVALARYDEGSRWRPAALTPGRALLELLAHTVVARSHPVTAMATLERVVSRAPAVKGRRGEAQETAARLLEAAS
ncbi:MAG: hypothetical protein DMF80_12440 [Acidobacteria bacterium]|nr:MAG: hypothetical protein DMF80_12440 [Acidobacteriota bacterium]PYQ22413.1 MAG: hypothetical protein DMF81_12160 [Acidobacteriota bacterium]